MTPKANCTYWVQKLSLTLNNLYMTQNENSAHWAHVFNNTLDAFSGRNWDYYHRVRI